MIGWLTGELRGYRDPGVLIDVGGVGYLVAVPGGTLAGADLGDTVELHIHTHVREDTLALFGFADTEALDAFHALLNVNGVGPKLALGVLGHLTSDDLMTAVETGDIARLKGCPGVGKRVAERLSLELKGKLRGVGAGPANIRPGPLTGIWADLKSALSNLGYRRKEIESAIAQLERSHPDADFDAVLREALNLLRR